MEKKERRERRGRRFTSNRVIGKEGAVVLQALIRREPIGPAFDDLASPLVGGPSRPPCPTCSADQLNTSPQYLSSNLGIYRVVRGRSVISYPSFAQIRLGTLIEVADLWVVSSIINSGGI